MCGIVGLISAFTNGFSTQEAGAFRDMLLIDTLRGFDSTGAFVVSNRGDVHIAKGAMNGAAYVASEEYTSVNQGMLFDGLFAVGHNRAATRGKVVDKNAHPFVIEDNIVLVQNGTYYGDHTHHADTEVDTEAVAHVIHRDGADIETALQKINAAYALVWYDVANKTLNVIRNKERPMYFAYPTEGCILFASEPGTIIAACMRNGLTLKDAPYMIQDSYLVQYTLDGKLSYDASYRDKLDIDFRPKAYPFRNNIAQISDNWYGHSQLACAYDHRPIVQDPKKVEISFHDLIAQGIFTESFAMPSDVASKMAELQGKSKFQDQRLVMWQDYYPANSHKNCRSWFVVGVAANAAEDRHRAVHYTLLHDVDEEVAMAMVLHEFYFVNTSTAINSSVKINNIDGHSFYQHIVSIYTTNLVKAEITLNETTTH